MQKDLIQLFQNGAEHAPETLAADILASVQRAAQKRELLKRYLWGGFTLASLAMLSFSSLYAAHSAAATGFTRYFSLIFSDTSAVAGMWKEVTLSLLESLPILGVGIALASVVAVLWSLRNLFRHTGRLSIAARAASAA